MSKRWSSLFLCVVALLHSVLTCILGDWEELLARITDMFEDLWIHDFPTNLLDLYDWRHWGVLEDLRITYEYKLRMSPPLSQHSFGYLIVTGELQCLNESIKKIEAEYIKKAQPDLRVFFPNCFREQLGAYCAAEPLVSSFSGWCRCPYYEVDFFEW
ncbi:hypothetical protein IFM89_034628 [Coptis chinensis]|uniref:Uncharacterized protein n=1 Tax=Coptis chinensis TaxID=261450 RepID=A0A835HWG1_9MAGN|nr:hypothetical protein IFM89_034628 [Coptis chinensis]